MHRRKLAIVVLAVVGLLATGCSQVADRLDGAPYREKDAAAARPVLTTKHWGVVDGLLSVMVENTTDHTLRYGESVIRALDDNGTEIASSLGRSDGSCCSIEDLAPGATYGVYLDIGPDAADVTQVTLTYRNLSWAAAGTPTATGDIRARGRRLVHEKSGAVVEAAVTSSRPITQVGVQAVLFDRDGRFLAVVSGRWTCLAAGTSTIRMGLFHDVPADTEIRSVDVHAISGDPTQKPPACRGSDRT